MPNTTTNRPTTRAARAEKSAEARRQREEKAAKAEAAGVHPLASDAVKEAVANGQVDETPTPDPASETPDVEVGAILDSVPAKGTGTRPSIWVDRINGAVDQLIQADKADGVAGAVMFVAKTPKTATTTANKVRTKIAEGLPGLVDGVTGENLVARGKVIFVTFKSAE